MVLPADDISHNISFSYNGVNVIPLVATNHPQPLVLKNFVLLSDACGDKSPVKARISDELVDL